MLEEEERSKRSRLQARVIRKSKSKNSKAMRSRMGIKSGGATATNGRSVADALLPPLYKSMSLKR